MKKIKLKNPVIGLDDYGRRSLTEAHRHQKAIEDSPIDERQEARDNFFLAMKEDPAFVAERIGWLIDGNYGHGEMLRAKQVIASPRMNRRAALTTMIGLYEWQSPHGFSVPVWKKLTSQEKKALDAAIDVVIEAAEQEMAKEQGG